MMRKIRERQADEKFNIFYKMLNKIPLMNSFDQQSGRFSKTINYNSIQFFEVEDIKL